MQNKETYKYFILYEGELLVDNLFCERLKQLRKKDKLTQGELASKLNIDRSTLTYYETGYRIPDIQKVALIADYFRVSVDYMLGRTNVRKYIPKDNEVIELLEQFYSLSRKDQNMILHHIKARRQKQLLESESKVAEDNRGF